MKKRNALLTVMLGFWCLMAAAQADTTSLLRQGENALARASDLRQQDKFAEAVPYLKQAEALFEQLHSTPNLIKTFSLRGATDPDLNVRSAYYEKAQTLLKVAGDKKGIIAILQQYAEVKMEQAQLPAAEDMLNESIRLSKELGMDRLQWSYGLLGAVQLQRGQLVDALKNELLAIKMGEQFGDTSAHMAEVYNYTAMIYSRMGKLDESTDYVRKAIGTGSHSQDPMLVVQFRSNLADLLIRRNKLRDALDNLMVIEKKHGSNLPLDARIQVLSRFLRCYSELKDTTSAERSALELMRYSDSLRPDEYEQLPIFTQLNRYLVWSGQYEKAKRFVDRQRMAGEKFKLPQHRMQTYFYRSTIDSALGDMASALRSFQMGTKIRDSVNNVNIANQLNQLHVQYETEKKDKELLLQKAVTEKDAQELALNHQTLALKQKDLLAKGQQVDLLTKQTQLQTAASQQQQQQIVIKQKNIELLQKANRIQEMDLERARFIRNVIIASALGLALMSVLVYSRYRMKKRSSEELAVQREEIRQKNVTLQALVNEKDRLLKEKEWLVKEVHHRVKNNLQMVISLLNSQSAYLSNEDAVAAIRESQRRMHAMSLIHQRLYEKDEATIDMTVYISDLVAYLRDSFDRDDVRFVLELQPLVLDVSKAVPVGLILNETITNSLKYGFPNGRAGQILVSLTANPSLVELIVADDGIGFPEKNFSPTKKSLGLSLVKGLTAQIGGTYAIANGKGVMLTIRFSPAQIGHSEISN